MDQLTIACTCRFLGILESWCIEFALDRESIDLASSLLLAEDMSTMSLSQTPNLFQRPPGGAQIQPLTSPTPPQKGHNV